MPQSQHPQTAPDFGVLPINEVCSLLSVSRSTVYRLVKAGSLRLIKIGCSSRIAVADLRSLIGGAA
jgi:excisionase family DNA binding protein